MLKEDTEKIPLHCACSYTNYLPNVEYLISKVQVLMQMIIFGLFRNKMEYFL